MHNLLYGTKRHICRIIIALSVAFIVNQYYSFSSQWWLPLATFFVMLTYTGSAIYQGILWYVCFLIVIWIVSYLFGATELIQVRSYDVTLGALIGIMTNVLIFPDRVDVSFRQSVSFIMKYYISYLRAIVHLLLTQQQQAAETEKILLEKALQRLPTWVYETGFDFTLQKGYRYFVMKISEVSEILFSIHHLARYPFPNELLEVIKIPLLESLKKIEQFFESLIQVLNLKNVIGETFDFYQDIEMMESHFKKKVPLNLDIIDVSKEYVYLIEFIYNMRELHAILIKMAEALREDNI